MARGRAASNLAMGMASLKSGVPMRPNVPNIGMTHAPGLAPPVNRMPMQPPARPLTQVSPTAINRVPAFPSMPATIAPPVIGGPSLSMPPTATDMGGMTSMDMPVLKMPNE